MKLDKLDKVFIKSMLIMALSFALLILPVFYIKSSMALIPVFASPFFLIYGVKYYTDHIDDVKPINSEAVD